MRDKLYLTSALAVLAVALFVGRNLLSGSVLLTWALTFAGATGVAILLVALYRVQVELQESRRELTRNQAEIEFALQVQQALFPRRFPDGSGLDFTAACIPARGIGGDYYDVLDLTDGRLAFAIADISGKGISAAILAANLQALLRTLVETNPTPRDICLKLNNHLYKFSETSRFATFFYADWNAEDSKLRYVNAGHNPPIWISSNGSCALDKGGFPLGMFCDVEFQMGECSLQPGDLLALYSDGITEKGERSGKEFGETRLRDILERHRNEPLDEIRERILGAVRSWQTGEAEDDMTLVLVRAGRRA